MNENPLFRALEDLCAFLNETGIDYILVGGLAVGIWSQPRATVDIDFLVSIGTEEVEDLQRSVKESGRFVFVHPSPMTFERVTLLRATLQSNTDIAVDFLLADDDFKREALRRKKSIKVSEFMVNIPTPEDLILLKLLSGRDQDSLDAKNIFRMQRESLDMAYIRMWAERLNIALDLLSN